MAEQPDDQVLASVLSMGSKQLEDIKRQGRLRQGVGALVLAGAAALTLLINPTAAITFAALAIAAVWMLPAARRAILGDHVAIRDSRGRIRIAMFVDHDGRPSMSLLDASGKLRMVFMMSSAGDPMLAMSDADGETRLTMGHVHQQSALDLYSDSSDAIGLHCTADGSMLRIHHDGSPSLTTEMSAGALIMSTNDADIALQATSKGQSFVQSRAGASTAVLYASAQNGSGLTASSAGGNIRAVAATNGPVMSQTDNAGTNISMDRLTTR